MISVKKQKEKALDRYLKHVAAQRAWLGRLPEVVTLSKKDYELLKNELLQTKIKSQ